VAVVTALSFAPTIDVSVRVAPDPVRVRLDSKGSDQP
jgi:hypothetical protein